jgi:hypothetical protein
MHSDHWIVTSVTPEVNVFLPLPDLPIFGDVKLERLHELPKNMLYPCLVPSRFQRGERKTRKNSLLGARKKILCWAREE